MSASRRVFGLVALLCAAAPSAAQDAPVMPPSGMTGPAPQAPGKTPAAKPSPKKKEAPAPVPDVVSATLTPRVWTRSAYSFTGRLVSAIQDVTFETPPAYQESFAFWAARMKGTARTEVIEYITSTSNAAETGAVPFHRQVTRYMIDLNEHGQVKTMGGKLNRDVQLLAWDGQFDPLGRVLEIKRVAGPEDATEVERLAFPLLERVLPALDAPRAVKAGEPLTLETTLPLPSRMSVNGLEDIATRLTRVLTLKEVRGSEAVFAVQATYALDPSTPPKAPRTTCVISGGGDGEAIFDLDAGYFKSARVTTKMLIDIEAPLRPLPGQPEGTDPGTGKSHLVLTLEMFGKLAASQMFTGDADAVSGGSVPEE